MTGDHTSAVDMQGVSMSPMSVDWYDESLNNESLWRVQGEQLIKASLDLKAAQNQPGNVLYDKIHLMLLAFGVENLLKGWHIRQGKKMAIAGKLTKTPGTPHDLAELVDYVGFPISEDERMWLRRLSYFSRFIGRYPGPTHMNEVWKREGLIGVP